MMNQIKISLTYLVCLVFVGFAGCGDDPPSADLTGFRFAAADNPGLGSDVTATIIGRSIAATLPFGTDVTHLVATFDMNADKLTVGGVDQKSGVTANDFTSAVAYHATASDGSSADYVVTVAVTRVAITDFGFLAKNNPGLSGDVTAVIDHTKIAATVPLGTDVTALVATFKVTDPTVKIGDAIQVSSTTPNDFTRPVIYTVTAADGSKQDFTVTVDVAADITAFKFLSASNTRLHTDVTATITDTAIAATVPFGTDVTALIATFTATGPGVKVGDTSQVSGTTPDDFTRPVSYAVIAANGTIKNFTVTVTVAAIDAKAITAFGFLPVNNTKLATSVIATISDTGIAATLPFGSDVTALVATFETIGASVGVGDTQQASGTTPNDFTKPVIYAVTAADGTIKHVTVTLTIAPDPALKAIAAFAFRSANNPDLRTDVTATITDTAISLTVPFGTHVTALVATFDTTGKAVQIGTTAQVSGTTANDFTKPVAYTVTAADNSTEKFTVTVTIASANANALTAFKFLSANNPGLGGDRVGKIAGSNIAVTVPAGTDVTRLVATFETTGASVAVGSTSQDSGATKNDFTSPVSYTVTADDLSKQAFTVTVGFEPNP
jgi:hypothetical protein